MQALFDLIHGLSREENKMYLLYRKKDTRLDAIFESYQKADGFDKSLDKKLAEKYYENVSRAFYSMQKRDLWDEILHVIVDIQQHSARQSFSQVYARLNFLEERRLSDGGLLMLERFEAGEQDHLSNEELLLLCIAFKKLLLRSGKPSFDSFNRLMERENILRSQIAQRKDINNIEYALTLLKINHDKLPQPEIRAKAAQYMTQLNAVAVAEDHLALKLDKMRCDRIYADLTRGQTEYHKRLSEFYEREFGKGKPFANHPDRFIALRELMISSLNNGDFLMLNGIIYKTNKEIEQLAPAIAETFLPTYYEICAVFHFYENDVLTAAKEIALALKRPNLPFEQFERCVFYRLAILIGSNLPIQALEEWNSLRKKHPNLECSPFFCLIHVMILFENNKPAPSILLLIDQYKNQIRRAGQPKSFIDALVTIETYIDNKNKKLKEVDFYPENWEKIIKIDQWLQTKREGKFYYNVALAAWEKRRRKF